VTFLARIAIGSAVVGDGMKGRFLDEDVDVIWCSFAACPSAPRMLAGGADTGCAARH
jgi:hypothetical protein